jgi:peroxiredoxin
MRRVEAGSRGLQHLAEGSTAPTFEFADPGGGWLRSSDLLARGPVLLTFYRGAWCDFCRSDLRDLASAMARIRGAGATVLGVFHEFSTEAGQRLTLEFGLDFPLVNDEGGRAAEAFGVRRPASEIARIESEFEPELLALKGGEPWIVPMQARFVIDRGGRLARSEIIFDYEERSSADVLASLLEGLD